MAKLQEGVGGPESGGTSVIEDLINKEFGDLKDALNREPEEEKDELERKIDETLRATKDNYLL